MSSHRESYCFTLLSNPWAFIFIFYLHAHICTYSAGSCTVMFNCSSHLLSYELVWFHLKMNFLFTVQSPLSRLADIKNIQSTSDSACCIAWVILQITCTLHYYKTFGLPGSESTCISPNSWQTFTLSPDFWENNSHFFHKVLKEKWL